jgi:hypothetical protein
VIDSVRELFGQAVSEPDGSSVVRCDTGRSPTPGEPDEE